MSITIPTANNTKFITNNIIILLLKLVNIHSLTICGTCINVKTLEKATDVAKINNIGAKVLMVSTQTSNISLISILLYIKTLRINA